MSRIGKQPIAVPSGVTVNADNGVFKVKGPKGELTVPYNTELTIKQDGDQLLPLLAHWSAQLAGSLKTTVEQGNKRVQHYVKSQPHQTLPLPPQWRTIAHFNTPQEYAQAQHTAQQLNIYADAKF